MSQPLDGAHNVVRLHASLPVFFLTNRQYAKVCAAATNKHFVQVHKIPVITGEKDTLLPESEQELTRIALAEHPDVGWNENSVADRPEKTEQMSMRAVFVQVQLH